MPARKKSGKKRSTGTSVVNVNRGELALPSDLHDEFAEFINQDKATATATGWPYISLQGATPVMKLGGQPIGGADGAFECIILGANRLNQYFESDFNPAEPATPDCYAVAKTTWSAGEVDSLMAPPEDLGSKRSDKCSTCELNAFGSGRGRGKACKNQLRLALIPSDTDPAKAEGVHLMVPPTSLKAWAAYVAPISAMGRPVATIVSKVRKVPNESGQGFKLEFSAVGPIKDKERLHAILGRLKGDVKTALESIPSQSVPEGGAKKAAPRRKKVVRKKTAARKR